MKLQQLIEWLDRLSIILAVLGYPIVAVWLRLVNMILRELGKNARLWMLVAPRWALIGAVLLSALTLKYSVDRTGNISVVFQAGMMLIFTFITYGAIRFGKRAPEHHLNQTLFPYTVFAFLAILAGLLLGFASLVMGFPTLKYMNFYWTLPQQLLQLSPSLLGLVLFFGWEVPYLLIKLSNMIDASHAERSATS